MKNQHRLRVSRTTLRTLDAAEMVVFGGTVISAIVCGPSGQIDPICNGSGGKDCATFLEIPR